MLSTVANSMLAGWFRLKVQKFSGTTRNSNHWRKWRQLSGLEWLTNRMASYVISKTMTIWNVKMRSLPVKWTPFVTNCMVTTCISMLCGWLFASWRRNSAQHGRWTFYRVKQSTISSSQTAQHRRRIWPKARNWPAPGIGRALLSLNAASRHLNFSSSYFISFWLEFSSARWFCTGECVWQKIEYMWLT